MENTTPHESEKLDAYECLNRFRAPQLRNIIEAIDIPEGTLGLDAGCGTGFITALLAERSRKPGMLIGMDISERRICHARNTYFAGNVSFIRGDVNSLQFRDRVFDWIWCMDTVWPGPREFGCLAEDPTEIMHEFYRVLKPGGSLFLLYWSSQKFLPGYPLLESRMNATTSANAPFTEGMSPYNHMMNAELWLREAGYHETTVHTFVANVKSPLNSNDRNAMQILMQMLWGESMSDLRGEDRELFMSISNPESDNYLFMNRNYYGFYSYTLFRATK